jgi:hypothetical protein
LLFLLFSVFFCCFFVFFFPFSVLPSLSFCGISLHSYILQAFPFNFFCILKRACFLSLCVRSVSLEQKLSRSRSSSRFVFRSSLMLLLSLSRCTPFFFFFLSPARSVFVSHVKSFSSRLFSFVLSYPFYHFLIQTRHHMYVQLPHLFRSLSQHQHVPFFIHGFF